MTILLHDYIELEERASRHLRIWKVWHVILYVLTAVFGVLNYVFMQNTMALVNDNCLLYPRNIQFHMVKKPEIEDYLPATIKVKNITNGINYNVTGTTEQRQNSSVNEPNSVSLVNDVNKVVDEKSKNATQVNDASKKEEDKVDGKSEKAEANDTSTNKKEKVNKTSIKELSGAEKNVSVETANVVDNTPRGVAELSNSKKDEIIVVVNNVTIVIENSTHRLMLDTSRTFFGKESNCQFAEFMPLLCTIFAIVWTTLFIMCPGGGRSTSGLQQPWRILMPALLFALVMVALTGHSFSLTNGGLQDFCSSFSNITNTTACSAVDRFVEKPSNSSWGVAGRISTARAASAGAWALWACGAAVLLARLLRASDFVVRRTGAYLARDPLQKITPHLQKTPRGGRRSAPNSPRRRDNSSVKSEPTVTTELVTASVEHAQDSTPTSLTVTPLKHDDRKTMIELNDSPDELFNSRR